MSGQSFKALRASALESCQWRGHRMKRDPEIPYTVDSYNGNVTCGWVCECGMHVIVETKPAPNSIDIHGEAVACNCPEVKGDASNGYQLVSGEHEIASWSLNEAYGDRWNVSLKGHPRSNYDKSTSAESPKAACSLAYQWYREEWHDRLQGYRKD